MEVKPCDRARILMDIALDVAASSWLSLLECAETTGGA